jgi:tRNA-specific 2-thiouridylase
VAYSEPLYVVDLDPVMNRVIVGTRESAADPECTVCRVNWVSIAPPDSPIRAEVRIRYRSQPVPVTVVPLPENRVHLRFDEPQFGVTPGQGAVWYEGDRLLGGGIIERKSKL